jgi:uncharacterized protein YprB with RNaseH-like and TPR domain
MKTLAFWDIETSALGADFGTLLTWAIKPIGKEPIVYINKHKGGLDKEACIALRNELEKHFILISYYGLGFDLKWLNSKLLYHGEKPLQSIHHLDLYRIAKKVFKIRSRRLKTVCQFLKIGGKTDVDPEVWRKASYGHCSVSLKEIAEHNKGDVVTLEEVFFRLCSFVGGISKV